MIDHLGENAELYPLGLLDDDAAREVERHIVDCTACARRVAQAQLAAASLAAALPAATPSPALGRRLRESARPRRVAGQPPPRSTMSQWRARPVVGRLSLNVFRFGLAATLLLAFLGLGLQTFVLRHRLASEDVALVAIVRSHFNHVSMTPRSANPVTAKILYARDGSWVYIVADKPAGTLRAVARDAIGTTDLGVLTPAGETATLLVRPQEHVLAITLERVGTPVASAKLTY